MSPRLDRYWAKRDFARTDEPGGVEVPPSHGQPRYAFQHHHASSEHYDLRLESDGVLLSWAVPKGPSTDPREKRLAVRTEDHPVDYLDFEGTIPSGEYGGGSVIVWDIGSWENLTTDDDDEPLAVADAVDGGHLRFRIDGEKLSGVWTLQRFRPEEDQWLLIKGTEGADARRNPTSTQPQSVLTGVTVDQVAEAVRAAAGELRSLLDELGLAPRVQSSGSRGLHVVVDVIDDDAGFDLTRSFSRRVAEVVSGRGPFTVEQRKAKRDGQLFLDVGRNGPASHAAAPYSLRPLPGAPVAVPLDWDEALASSFHPRRITIANLARRLAQKDDPWAGREPPTTTIADALDALTEE